MSAVGALFDLLKEEADILERRAFDDLEGITQRKEELLAKVEPQEDERVLQRLREMATQNERKLKIMLSATRQLNARMAQVEHASTSVGYSADGGRVSCDLQKSKMRV